MSTVRERNAATTALPAVDGDFYQIAGLLSEDDRQLLGRVRVFMEEQVAPIINHYWVRAAEGDWIAVDETTWRQAERGRELAVCR